MIIIVGAVKKVLPVSSDGAVVENAKPPATLLVAVHTNLHANGSNAGCVKSSSTAFVSKTTTPILFAYLVNNWGEPEQSPTLLHSDGIYNIIMYPTSTVTRFPKISGKHNVIRKAQRALIRVCMESK